MRVEKLYEDHKKLIHREVYNHHKRYGGDVEELVSQANELFMDILLSYDSDKAEFSTWLVIKLRFHLREEFREKIRKSKTRPTCQYPEHESYEFGRSYKHFDCKEFMESLSKDGKFVLSLIYDMPMDIWISIRQRGDDSPKNIRRALREYLNDLDWSYMRILKVFKEINKALKGYET